MTLRSDPCFVGYVRRVARRYFHCPEDAEDAEGEAWEKIAAADPDLEVKDYQEIARRAIAAAYMRQWRRRKQIRCRRP